VKLLGTPKIAEELLKVLEHCSAADPEAEIVKVRRVVSPLQQLRGHPQRTDRETRLPIRHSENHQFSRRDSIADCCH
jgi:hypothetical protein